MVTLREYQRWSASSVFEHCAAVDTASFTLLGAGAPERIEGVLGVLGVLSLSVTRRAREFGIRMALGASQRGILRLVMREAMGLIGAGVAMGTVLAILSRRFLSALLFGVAAGDPAVYAVAIAVLGAAGVLACWIPARRAARADPAAALREE